MSLEEDRGAMALGEEGWRRRMRRGRRHSIAQGRRGGGGVTWVVERWVHYILRVYMYFLSLLYGPTYKTLIDLIIQNIVRTDT